MCIVCIVQSCRDKNTPVRDECKRGILWRSDQTDQAFRECVTADFGRTLRYDVSAFLAPKTDADPDPANVDRTGSDRPF